MQDGIIGLKLGKYANELESIISLYKSKIENDEKNLRAHYEYFDRNSAIKMLQKNREVLKVYMDVRELLYKYIPELKPKEEIAQCLFY